MQSHNRSLLIVDDVQVNGESISSISSTVFEYIELVDSLDNARQSLDRERFSHIFIMSYMISKNAPSFTESWRLDPKQTPIFVLHFLPLHPIQVNHFVSLGATMVKPMFTDAIQVVEALNALSESAEKVYDLVLDLDWMAEVNGIDVISCAEIAKDALESLPAPVQDLLSELGSTSLSDAIIQLHDINNTVTYSGLKSISEQIKVLEVEMKDARDAGSTDVNEFRKQCESILHDLLKNVLVAQEQLRGAGQSLY